MRRARIPVVQLTPACWRMIAAEAAGAHRESGGLLLGQRTRYGNLRVYLQVALPCVTATEDQILYDEHEEEHARAMADEAYAPQYQVVGEWHIHPYDCCCAAALLTQISDDWDDPGSDVNVMRNGEVELVVSSFPAPEYTAQVLRSSEHTLQRIVADRICRAEVWYRVRRKQIVPCPVRVRSM